MNHQQLADRLTAMENETTDEQEARLKRNNESRSGESTKKGKGKDKNGDKE